MTDSWGYVRISQESDASLDEQKESIREYARSNGLNLQTTRNEGKRTSGFDVDGRPEYKLLREKIEGGNIDAVITRDRARLARDFDERLWLITAMRSVGVEWHVVEEGRRLGLEDVQKAGMECLHAMMDHYKKAVEIERAKAAVEKRMEAGHDHGAPRYGMTYSDDGTVQVPGDGFDDVVDVIEARSDGLSFAEIEDETGVSSSTAQRIVENEEWYRKRSERL